MDFQISITESFLISYTRQEYKAFCDSSMLINDIEQEQVEEVVS